MKNIELDKEIKNYESIMNTYFPILKMIEDIKINTENANMVKEAGADMLVSGSAIINAGDYKEVVDKLKQ